MTSKLRAKDFTLVASPCTDDNYAFAIFRSSDQEYLTKIGPSATTFIQEEVEEQIQAQYELCRSFHESYPELFPAVSYHKRGLVVRDFASLCYCNSERQPELSSKYRRRLRALTDSIIHLQNNLNEISLSLESHTRKNRIRTLELEEQREFDELRRLQQLEVSLTVLLTLCDAAQAIHTAGELHLEINPFWVGLNFQNQVQLVPSLPYASQQLQRRHYSHLLGGVDTLAPELLMGAPLTKAADVYQIATCFVQHFIKSSDGRTDLQQVHDTKQLENLIPESFQALRDVILSALNEDPKLRPQTAQDFAEQVANSCSEPFRGSGESVDARVSTHVDLSAKSSANKRGKQWKSYAIIGMSLSLLLMLSVILLAPAEASSVVTPEDSLAAAPQVAMGPAAEDTNQQDAENLPADQTSRVVITGGNAADQNDNEGSIDRQVDRLVGKLAQTAVAESKAPPKDTPSPPSTELEKEAPVPPQSEPAQSKDAQGTPNQTPNVSPVRVRPSSSLPSKEDTKELMLKALHGPPQIAGATTIDQRLRLPQYVLADDVVWTNAKGGNDALWNEYVHRLENTGKLVVKTIGVDSAMQDKFVQQYRSARALNTHDFRLDLLTALGLERHGASQLAFQAYESAFRKWHAQIAMTHKMSKPQVYTAQPATLWLRFMVQRNRWQPLLHEITVLAPCVNFMLSQQEATNTLEFVAWALATVEKRNNSREVQQQMRATALAFLAELETLQDQDTFTQALINYRDQLSSVAKPDSSAQAVKLEYRRISDSILSSLKGPTWQAKESYLLSQTSTD